MKIFLTKLQITRQNKSFMHKAEGLFFSGSSSRQKTAYHTSAAFSLLIPNKAASGIPVTK